MRIRLAHTTDAAAVNELLHQLGYPQDGTATTATESRPGVTTSPRSLCGRCCRRRLGLVAVHICPFFETHRRVGRIVV